MDHFISSLTYIQFNTANATESDMSYDYAEYNELGYMHENIFILNLYGYIKLNILICGHYVHKI